MSAGAGRRTGGEPRESRDSRGSPGAEVLSLSAAILVEVVRPPSARGAVWATAACALILGVAAYAWWTWQGAVAPKEKFVAADVTGADWGRGFDLTDFNGKRRTLADFRGKLVLLFFGYTNCPDMCPTTMAKLAQVMQLAGPDAERMQGLFITVDPKRDTAKVLSQYVPAFYPAFLGLRGNEQETAGAAKEFKVYFQAQKPGDSGYYTVDHSGPVFVFDRRGRLRLFVRHEMGAEAILRDLRVLLKEPA